MKDRLLAEVAATASLYTAAVNSLRDKPGAEGHKESHRELELLRLTSENAMEALAGHRAEHGC